MISQKKQGEAELVALIALVTSLGALSIDAVLPALPNIGESFGMTEGGNALQQIVGVLFLGMTIGQLVYGPLSDRYGRKPILYLGMAVFVISSLICIAADNLTMMLAGRFMQGMGAAALRIVPMSIVRDQYEGAAMARIMSLTMAVFIIVPCIAPMLGQGILSFAGWQAIFWFLLALTAMAGIWVGLRQPETLPVERRSVGGLAPIRDGLIATLSNRTTRNYMIAGGLMMGGFMGYVMSAEQIYRDIYETGDLFALYFAITAAAIGVASVVNARLMQTYSPQQVSRIALRAALIISGLALVAGTLTHLPLNIFVTILAGIFFCNGLMIGNMNAIALQPLGHIAGLANSAISFLSGCISMVIGSAIGAGFNMTVLPLLLGFFIACLLAMLVLRQEHRAKSIPANHSPI